MITSYSKPQDTITLLREIRQNGVARRRNPVVVGPQYLLSRHGTETLPTTTFSTSLTELPLSYDVSGVTTTLPDTYVADIADVTLWGDNLLLPLLTGTAPSWTKGSTIRQLRCDETIAGTGLTVNSAYGTRGLKIGDVLLIDDDVGGSALIRRRVTALLGTALPASPAVATSFIANSYNPTDTVASPSTTAVTSTVDMSAGDISGATFTLTDWTANLSGFKYLGESAACYTAVVTSLPDSLSAVITVTRAGSAWSTTAEADVAANVYSFVFYDEEASVDGSSLEGEIQLDVTMDPGKLLTEGSSFTFIAKDTYTNADYIGSIGAAKIRATGGTFSGTADTTLIVEVVTGGDAASAAHAFRVRDTGGQLATELHSYDNMSAVATFQVLGLNIELPVAAYHKGDVFYINCTAAANSTTVFNGVQLDGPAYDAALLLSNDIASVDAFVPFTGQIPETACGTWELDGNNLVFSALSITGDDVVTEPETGYGTLSIGFKAIVPVSATESLIAIESVEDIETYAGVVDLDNPLAWSVAQAISGTQGDMVYLLRTAGLTYANFATALIKVSSTDLVYAFVPVGDIAQDVRELLRTHMEEQSVPTKKNFRRCYIGIDSPGSFRRVGPSTMGVPHTVQILEHDTDGNIWAVFDDDVDLNTAGVRGGDILRTIVGDTETDYVIDYIVDADGGTANQAMLVTGPASPIESSTTAEVWAADTADNQIDYLVAVARSLASSRAILVWCEGGTAVVDSETRDISSQHIAAEIAGLRCALLPQAGLTSYEVSAVTSAAPMYTRYTDEQLNRAASNGVFVITQEIVGGPVFIRHQLTTDTDNGILYWEDSVGVNHDDLGFQVKDAFVGYKGRKNVTERTRAQIEGELYQIAVNATQGFIDEELGPQITGFHDEKGVAGKVTVRQHPIYKDRFVTFFAPGMPVPLNGIDHTIYGEITDLI